MRTPNIETERLILRPLKISDAQTVFDNWASDPEATKHMRFDTHKSIDATIEWLTLEEGNLESDTAYNWGFTLKETGELFGSGGCYFRDDKGMFELGYILMKKQWGKGFATEAARAIVDFAVRKLKRKNLYVIHAKDNPESGRVIQKLGFTYHGDGEYSSLDGKRVFPVKEYYYRRSF
ncbi:MAG: GNAT family N-acetyltransferase [Oscillospiraceae bacterium]|nr:GNAT family N-acetyltransferase [Oscillospiraceae bacterium]